MGLNNITGLFIASDADTELAAQAQAILTLYEACRSTTENVELEPFVDLLPELEVSKYSTTLPCLVEYYRLRVQHFQAGQIINYADQWQKLTSDPEILETVTVLLLAKTLSFTKFLYELSLHSNRNGLQRKQSLLILKFFHCSRKV